MKLQKFLALFLLLALVMPVSNVMAQSVTEDFFFKSTSKYIPSPKEDKDSLKSATRAGFARNAIRAHAMENDETVSADEDFGPLRKSTTRKANAAYYDTFQTHLDGINSEGVKSWMNQAGKGVVALFKYAQNQTEPSIAVGSAQAQQLVFDIQRQVLDGDRTFRAQLEANPELKEITLATYNGCLKKQFKAGKKWIEAISICQNDKVESSASGTPAAGFTEVKGEVLDATMHPDRDTETATQKVTSSTAPDGVTSATSVGVIDSLINQAVKVNGIDGDKAQEFGDNFKSWFGDILVKVEKGASDQALIIKEGRVEPTRKLSQMVDEVADERFDTLMKLLKAACEAKKGASAPTKIGENKDYWSDQADEEDLRSVSIPELGFKRAVGDAMLLVIKNSRSDGTYDCEAYNKTAATVKADDTYLEAYNLYYIYAHQIAIHQILMSFEKALELTSRLAGAGNENNPLRVKAFSLIAEPFGTLDFAGLRERNTQLLLANLQDGLFAVQSQETGQAGSRTTGSMNQGAVGN